MKIDSVLEEARADAAVVAPGAARERVWQNLSRPRRSRPTVLLFAGSAALGALLCLGIVRLLAPRAHDEEAVAVLQGAVQNVAPRHVKVDSGAVAELVLHGPAQVDVGARHVELEEGLAQVRVAADGSGSVRVDSGRCFLTDSEGRHRVTGTLQFGQRLSEEVALYERGWSQLGPDPKSALAAFDELLRRFPNGALVQEERLSRVEALQALGRRAEAAQEARSFLQDFPQSERAAELKKLLEEK